MLQCDEDTLRTIQGLGQIQSTNVEAAAVLGVSRETFEQFLGNNEKAAETFERAKEKGKSSLRRLQFKSAQDGNVTMQIWLGKQLLGQKDKQELDVKHSVSDMSDEELDQFIADLDARASNSEG